MKIARIKIITSIILLIALYTLFQSYVNKISYLIALDRVLNSIFSETWKFVSSPTIFVTLVIIVIIFVFRENILSIFPAIKEISAGVFSAKLDFPESFLESNHIKGESQIDAKKGEVEEYDNTLPIEIDAVAAHWISKINVDTAQFILDTDRKIYSVEEMVKRISEINFVTTYLKSGKIDLADKRTKAFYIGVYKTFHKLVIPHFFSWKRNDEGNTAYFELLPGVRDHLLARLEELSSNPNETSNINL